MRWVGLLPLAAILAGCVSYAPQYAGPLQPYPSYAPLYPSYASSELLPLPENLPRRPAPPSRTVARPRTTATMRAAAPASTPAEAAAVVPAATPATPAGPECRTVTQVGYADGQEVKRLERLCRASPGQEWVRS